MEEVKEKQEGEEETDKEKSQKIIWKIGEGESTKKKRVRGIASEGKNRRAREREIYRQSIK